MANGVTPAQFSDHITSLQFDGDSTIYHVGMNEEEYNTVIDVLNAEDARETAENYRLASEGKIGTYHYDSNGNVVWDTQGSGRLFEEQKREIAESQRIAAENERDTAEGELGTFNSSTKKYEGGSGRLQAEQQRLYDESNRVSEEKKRVKAETTRSNDFKNINLQLTTNESGTAELVATNTKNEITRVNVDNLIADNATMKQNYYIVDCSKQINLNSLDDYGGVVFVGKNKRNNYIQYPYEFVPISSDSFVTVANGSQYSYVYNYSNGAVSADTGKQLKSASVNSKIYVKKMRAEVVSGTQNINNLNVLLDNITGDALNIQTNKFKNIYNNFASMDIKNVVSQNVKYGTMTSEKSAYTIPTRQNIALTQDGCLVADKNAITTPTLISFYYFTDGNDITRTETMSYEKDSYSNVKLYYDLDPSNQYSEKKETTELPDYWNATSNNNGTSTAAYYTYYAKNSSTKIYSPLCYFKDKNLVINNGDTPLLLEPDAYHKDSDGNIDEYYFYALKSNFKTIENKTFSDGGETIKEDSQFVGKTPQDIITETGKNSDYYTIVIKNRTYYAKNSTKASSYFTTQKYAQGFNLLRDANNLPASGVRYTLNMTKALNGYYEYENKYYEILGDEAYNKRCNDNDKLESALSNFLDNNPEY